MKTKVLILGAGPSGLAAGLELSKAGVPFILAEKNQAVGGLSRTLSFNGFKTDIGPHRFFSKNRYLYDLIADLLGEDWIKVNRFTRFHVRGRFLIYPVEIKDALKNVGFIYGARILRDYFWERLKALPGKKEYASFEDKIVADFGRSLAELNMLNYTEKIWGLPCSRISTDWASQRIKDLSLVDVVRKMLFKDRNSPKTLVDQFYYPKNGSSMIYEAMRARIEKSDCGRLFPGCEPLKFYHDGKKITKVLCRGGDGEFEIEAEKIISTIPITELINMQRLGAEHEAVKAAAKLIFRSHVSLFLALDRPNVFRDQWIYFPDRKIPFGRIMEPKNFSAALCPPGKTSLLIEFFCWENDGVWNASKEELVDSALPWLEKIFGLKKAEISDSFVHREKYAYPVYDTEYKASLDKAKNCLDGFENLILAGRSGLFRYNNQDHALEMGILSARSVIDSKKYDIETVGAEKEYFEKGYAG